MARIVLLGATGFTGRLIAQRLAGDPTETVLAGRSSQALAAMADEAGGGCKTATVRLDKPTTLTELLEPGDVLVTTVGSFLSYGDVAVSAAVDTGAHYLDTTGEAPFVRRLVDDPRVAVAPGAFLDMSPLRISELVRPGHLEPNGLGAVRRVGVIGPTQTEEVTLFERPTRFGYTLRSGLPVRDHVATVDLAPTSAGGTDIRYHVRSTPALPLPGFGLVLGLILRKGIGDLPDGIVRAAELTSR